jgi:hypothetical protein
MGFTLRSGERIVKHDVHEDVHIGRESVQCFIKEVHLHEDAPNDYDTEGVCAWMGELVVPTKRKFDSNTETFDSHDRHGAD